METKRIVSQSAPLTWQTYNLSRQTDNLSFSRQTDNLSLSRLSVIQSLLTHGIITHAQYMNFMYMKGVMEMHTIEKEESVLAEVQAVPNSLPD